MSDHEIEDGEREEFKLLKVTHCEGCDTEHHENVKFCGYCGTLNKCFDVEAYDREQAEGEFPSFAQRERACWQAEGKTAMEHLAMHNHAEPNIKYCSICGQNIDDILGPRNFTE